jgi:hypothetical protein
MTIAFSIRRDTPNSFSTIRTSSGGSWPRSVWSEVQAFHLLALKKPWIYWHRTSECDIWWNASPWVVVSLHCSLQVPDVTSHINYQCTLCEQIRTPEVKNPSLFISSECLISVVRPPALYPGGPEFKLRLGDWLYSLRFLVVFLNPFR